LKAQELFAHPSQKYYHNIFRNFLYFKFIILLTKKRYFFKTFL